MDSLEILHKAYNKYLEWWIPLDIESDSAMAAVQFSRFLEKLLILPEIGHMDRFIEIDKLECKTYELRSEILKLLYGHWTKLIDLNDFKSDYEEICKRYHNQTNK